MVVVREAQGGEVVTPQQDEEHLTTGLLPSPPLPQPGGLMVFVLLWREDLATVRLADHHLGPIDHCLRVA